MSDIGNKTIFSENLKHYIAKSGKSRRELAEAWDVPYSTLTEWINGKKYPRIDKIEVMASYFGVLKSALIENRMTEQKESDNNTISDIVARLRTDSSFLSAVVKLYRFNNEQVVSVNQMLNAFFKDP